jgi:outer membrane protein TolC
MKQNVRPRLFDVMKAFTLSSPPMRIFGMVAALVSTGIAALAQTNAPDARKLSIEDCIEISLHHNLSVQISRFNPEIDRFTLQGIYGVYEPTLSFSGEHDYNRTPGGVDAQGRSFGGTETDADSFSAGLSGLLPWGMNYSLGGSISDQYGTRPGIVPDLSNPTIVTNSFFDINSSNTVSFLSTNFGSLQSRTPFESTAGRVGLLQIRQPLLKNFWIDSTRLQIFVDKKNLQIDESVLRQQVMQTVTDVEKAYFSLIAARENITVQQQALELNERQLAINKKKVEVGALAPLDEKQAQSQVAQSRADLINAIGAEATSQRVLKSLLSDEYSEWKDVTIEPVEKLVAIPQQFNLQESWRKGLSQRPELLQAKLGLEKQGQVVRYQKNQLFPQLDVFGSAGYNTSAKEFSGAFDQIANRDNPFWSGGAQITFPLTQRTARNSYRSSRAAREQLELGYKQLEQGVLIGIEDAIAAANTSFQATGSRREARIYAEAALDAEQKKLESGKSTSFQVLQLTRDLTTARSAEITALTQYNMDLAEIARREGSTFERRHITLEWK